MLCVFDGKTGIVENNLSLELDKEEIKENMRWMFDVNNSGDFSLSDSSEVENMITRTNDLLPIYYIEDTSGNSTPVKVLINDNGLCLNEEAEKCLGYDIDRNGYIDKCDARYISKYMSASGNRF